MDEAKIGIIRAWEKSVSEVESEALDLRLQVERLFVRIKYLDTRSANLRRWIAEKKAEQSQGN